jgi:SAM-dependent methyltransferase
MRDRVAASVRVTWTALRSRSTRAFYDRLAPHYDRLFVEHEAHAERMLAELRRAFPDSNRAAVLDLGCGTGLLARKLAGAGFRTVGVDPSPRSLAILARAEPHIAVVQGVAGSLPFASGSFDAVACLGAWRHVGNPERAVDEVARVLADDGIFLVGYFPPKLGGLFVTPAGAWGRLVARAYERAAQRLGHDDRVGEAHETRTFARLREHFRVVERLPSGVTGRLIRAGDRAGFHERATRSGQCGKIRRS